MPEPASAALRRLHEEAHEHEVLSSRGERARRTLDAALPALADLVAANESYAAAHRMASGGHCGCRLCTTLAALRERLEARP